MLIIYTDGGLGNRISCLLNGLYIQRILDVEGRVFWPVNESCGLSYSELFDGPIVTENENKLSVRRLPNCSVLSIDNFLGLQNEFFMDPWKIATKKKMLGWCRDQIDIGRTLVVFGHRIFPQIYSESSIFMNTHAIFKPNVISHAITLEHENFFGKRFFGIHFRGTDGSRGISYKVITILVAYILNNVFQRSGFLATDDLEFAERVRRFIPKMSVFWHERPKKKYTGLLWNDRVRDSNYELHPYNIVRHKESVICSAYELFVLSRSYFILVNSYSTFLEIAGLYSKRRTLHHIFRIINKVKHCKVLIIQLLKDSQNPRFW